MIARELLRMAAAEVGPLAWARMNEPQQRYAVRSTLCAVMLQSDLPTSHWRDVYAAACRIIEARQWGEEPTL